MDEVAENLKEWMENPYYAAYYNDAPSEKCKEYVALDLYYSETEDDETAKKLDELEKQLSSDDLRHLMKYCGNTPRKAALAQMAAERG